MVRESLKGRPNPIFNTEREFNPAFRAVHSEFDRDSMQDAHEYWTVLVDMLHEEANAALVKNRPKEIPDFKSGSEAWHWHVLYHDDSPLSKLFLGQTATTMTCLICGHKSYSWTCILQIQLEIDLQKEPLTLKDCFDNFLKPEVSPSSRNCGV